MFQEIGEVIFHQFRSFNDFQFLQTPVILILPDKQKCIFLDDGISISQMLIRGRLANVCTFFTNAADPPSLGRPLSSISVAAKQPKTDQSKLGQPPQKEKM